MIEKRYTGVAKQGADVVANPTLDGSEQALNSIQINGENFKIEGGGELVKEKMFVEIWDANKGDTTILEEVDTINVYLQKVNIDITKPFIIQFFIDNEKYCTCLFKPYTDADVGVGYRIYLDGYEENTDDFYYIDSLNLTNPYEEDGNVDVEFKGTFAREWGMEALDKLGVYITGYKFNTDFGFIFTKEF